MKRIIFYLLVLIAAASCTYDEKPVYKDASADIEDRIEDLVGRMTLDEKILQLTQSILGVNTVENNFGGALDKIPSETLAERGRIG